MNYLYWTGCKCSYCTFIVLNRLQVYYTLYYTVYRLLMFLLYYTVCTCIFCAVQAASVFPVLYKLQVYFFTVLLLVYFLYWTTETVKLFPVLYRLQVCSSCTQPPLRTMSLRRAVGKQYLARMWWVEYLIYNYKLHFN